SAQCLTVSSTVPPNTALVSARLPSLDSLFSSRGVTGSAIKIDVEGSELSVLQGARDTTRTFGPRLLIEVHGRQNLSPIRASLHSLNMMILSETPASKRPDEERRFVLARPSQYHAINSG